MIEFSKKLSGFEIVTIVKILKNEFNLFNWYKIYTRKTTHIIIKLPKASDKQAYLKAARKKNDPLHRNKYENYYKILKPAVHGTTL